MLSTPDFIVIVQRLQERGHIGYVLLRPDGFAALLPGQRLVSRVDVIAQCNRQIVEFISVAVRVFRIPLRRIRVALHVEPQRILERVEPPVAKED